MLAACVAAPDSSNADPVVITPDPLPVMDWFARANIDRLNRPSAEALFSGTPAMFREAIETNGPLSLFQSDPRLGPMPLTTQPTGFVSSFAGVDAFDGTGLAVGAAGINTSPATRQMFADAGVSWSINNFTPFTWLAQYQLEIPESFVGVVGPPGANANHRAMIRGMVAADIVNSALGTLRGVTALDLMLELNPEPGSPSFNFTSRGVDESLLITGGLEGFLNSRAVALPSLVLTFDLLLNPGEVAHIDLTYEALAVASHELGAMAFIGDPLTGKTANLRFLGFRQVGDPGDPGDPGPTPVPEPASMLLTGGGLLALAARVRARATFKKINWTA